jgi:hypothetical protein
VDRCVQNSAARRTVNNNMSHTTGYFTIIYNDNLEYISLPALSQVHGDPRVIGNNELTSIVVSVTNVLSFFDNAALTHLSVPKLGYIYNTIGIYNNTPALPSLPHPRPAPRVASPLWAGRDRCRGHQPLRHLCALPVSCSGHSA